MNSKLIVKYHVDKLILIYQTPDDFIQRIAGGDIITQFFSGYHNVFICTKLFFTMDYVVPKYRLEYEDSSGNPILIGDFKIDIKNAITLTIDNAFLYSGNLELLYQMENHFNLELIKIAQIDVACDSNHNLPRKLNDMMHRSDCTLTRRGTKFPETEKGNQIIGTKVVQNIKILKDRECPGQSYYFQLKPSGSRRDIVLRGYDKGKEITEKSHKKYIQECNGFGDSIHRLEISTHSYDLKKQSKNKSGFPMEQIYRNLNNENFLKDFFITYINRIATLNIGSTRIKISKFLRLE